MGYSPRGHKESDTTKRLHFHFLSYIYRNIYIYIFFFFCEWTPEDRVTF